MWGGVFPVERAESPELSCQRRKVAVGSLAVVIVYPAAEIHTTAAKVLQFSDA